MGDEALQPFTAIETAEEAERVLAHAVAMGRAYLLDKKRYEEVRQLDEAINKYKQLKSK